MKHHYVLFLALLCKYSSQAKSINGEFTEIISEIAEKIDEIVSEFKALIHELLRDLPPFFKYLHSIKAQLDELPEYLPCSQYLREQLAKLTKEAANKIFKHNKAKLLELFAIYEAFNVEIKKCIDDLHSFDKFYACDDIECKMEIKAKAEDQLRRAIVGTNVRVIMARFQAQVVDIEETIDEITRVYLPRLAKIVKTAKTCK